MRTRRFLSLLMALSLMLGLFQLPAAAADVEAPAAWAAEQMANLDDAGILGAQNDWHPTWMISRGRFAWLMVNVLQREGVPGLLSAVPPIQADYFSDLGSKEGYGGRYNMYDAVAYGLMDGVREGNQLLADCDNNVSREQAAKMICSLVDALERYCGPLGQTVGSPMTFADAADISPWAVEWVNRASALGIMKGNNEGKFEPQNTLSIQEAYVMIDRVFRMAEEARIQRDKSLGIESLKTAEEMRTDFTPGGLVGHTVYLLERNGVRSILQITDHEFEFNSAAMGLNQSSRVWLETFDASGTSTGVRDIPMELDFCAAFYEGKDAYYLAFGQENMEENDSKEVYRIVRYDKDWNRLDAASVTGGESHTTIPYHFSGHTAMAEENGLLLVHTARQRYLSPDDGLRHQSNITIKISLPDMTVQSVSTPSPANHVSHSFAQYVAFDNGSPVYVDEGDAFPRGFTLNVENAQGGSAGQNFFPFSGEIGDNITNANPGGFGISGNNYLFAGSSSPQKGNDKMTYCNTFLAVIPKGSSGAPQIKWLTNFPADEREYVPEVRMVQMNANTFVVMWQSQKQDPRTVMGGVGAFCYAVFDGQGNQVGQTVTLENYAIPKNDPTVLGSRILWARTEMGPYGVFNNSRSRYLKVYELEIPLN